MDTPYYTTQTLICQVFISVFIKINKKTSPSFLQVGACLCKGHLKLREWLFSHLERIENIIP